MDADTPAKPGPKPHRCNDRIEDFLQAVFTLELNTKIRPAWNQLRACLRSQPGSEPKDPYLVIPDGKIYLERQERKSPWNKPQ